MVAKKRFCIDAGHYGKYNRSAVVPTFYESDFNWKFHLLLKKYLELYDAEVTLTRKDKDVNMDLYERGRCAKEHDLFLSIHANWAQRSSADYPVSYVPINGSADALGLKLAKCVAAVMQTKEAGRIDSKQSTKGAWDWYGVIYGAVSVGVPGIILEHSFYSNERSAKWLMDDGNLEKMARSEAEVIAEHYGLKKTDQAYTRREFVMDIQKACGAAVDGIAGPETLSKTPTLSATQNARHAAVKAVQRWLYAQGYTEAGAADGIAGRKFTAAVMRFQSDNHCVADGEITAKNKTWRKLLGME